MLFGRKQITMTNNKRGCLYLWWWRFGGLTCQKKYDRKYYSSSQYNKADTNIAVIFCSSFSLLLSKKFSTIREEQSCWTKCTQTWEFSGPRESALMMAAHNQQEIPTEQTRKREYRMRNTQMTEFFKRNKQKEGQPFAFAETYAKNKRSVAALF